MEPESKSDQIYNNEYSRDQVADEPSNFLYEKLLEAFESMIEKVLDRFTYSRFVEMYGEHLNEYYEKTRIEYFIHQLRTELRKDFKTVFFALTAKYKLKENLRTIVTEIEKAKILKEFEQITGTLFSQGPEYYFDFLAGVVQRLKETNQEVRSESPAATAAHQHLGALASLVSTQNLIKNSFVFLSAESVR